MFTYKRSIHLQDADPAGVVFFGKVYDIAQEAFEKMIREFDFPINRIIYQSEIIFPIIHSQAEYPVPIRLGHDLVINVMIGKISDSSFTLVYEFFHNEIMVCRVKTIHVAINRKKWEKDLIPGHFKHDLGNLKRFEE